MTLSVIILNYNVRYFLEQTIRSVLQAIASIDAEIIVIDNNSQDDSAGMMKEVFPNIKFIQNRENVGYSVANNQAVKEARGEYVCILNPDTAVPHNVFRDCLNFASQTPKLGALGVKMMDGTGNFLPESKRNVPTPMASTLKLLGLAKRKNSYYANDVAMDQIGEVAILPGAFMFLKRSIYAEVGGFDEDYFMYGEDIDISYKILKAGYKNYYLGSSVILHYKGESPQHDSVYIKRFYGAIRIFYRKHFRTNIITDFMLRSGLFVTKNLRRASMKRRITKLSAPKEVMVITDNINLLKALSKIIETPMRSASKLLLNDNASRDTLFIFDEGYVSYAQIFNAMESLKNRNNRFRIRPSGCNFILGSDKSDEKGVVDVF